MVAERYVESLEKLSLQHKMIKQLSMINESENNHQRIKDELNKIDQEGKHYMQASEKKCRKIRSGMIPFSPEACRWIRKAQVYRSLLQWQAGRRKNRGNLLRLALRVGIEEPFCLTQPELTTHLKICNTKCTGLQRSGWLTRRKFLRGRQVDVES